MDNHVPPLTRNMGVRFSPEIGLILLHEYNTVFSFFWFIWFPQSAAETVRKIVSGVRAAATSCIGLKKKIERGPIKMSRTFVTESGMGLIGVLVSTSGSVGGSMTISPLKFAPSREKVYLFLQI